MAPMYSGIGSSSGFVEGVGSAGLGDLGIGRGAAGDEDVADAEVVDEAADQGADERPDDRYPEVVVHVAVIARHRDRLESRHPGPQAGTEVAGGVDRVARVRA